MNFAMFKTLALQWIMESVVPAVVPPGPARWIVAFAGAPRIGAVIDQVQQVLPMTPDGTVDIAALEAAVDRAFRIQPTLEYVIPEDPSLATLKLAGTKVTFTRKDFDSLLNVLRGTTTVTEVVL